MKILARAFNMDEAALRKLQPRFLKNFTLQTNFTKTLAFPGIDQLLKDLESANIAWGIVTNKNTLTTPLLKATGYLGRSACVVCGDTTSKSKPHPEPLYYACELLKVAPKDCLYIGDAATDVQAGKAAGMSTMAVSFGYIPTGESVKDWQADYIADTAAEILPWIKKWSEQRGANMPTKIFT